MPRRRFYDDDEPELSRPQGVSGFWKILAIFETVLLVVLLPALVILGVALAVQLNRPEPPPQRPPLTTANTEPPQLPDLNLPDLRRPQAVNPQNLPYPTRPDAQPVATRPEPPGQGRFLALAREVWRAPDGQYPMTVSVSPDGGHIAYLANGGLYAGRMDGPRPVTQKAVLNPMPLELVGLLGPGEHANDGRAHPAGPLTWESDSRRLYFSDDQGHLWHDDSALGFLNCLGGGYGVAAPSPSQPGHLLLVRHHARVKLDVPGLPLRPDRTEIVLWQPSQGAGPGSRSVVPISEHVWSYIAPSSDGGKLALVADEPAGPYLTRGRLFLVDRPGAGPRDLKLGGSVQEPVAWTPDGRSLLYARTTGDQPFAARDLYVYDVAGGRETCLSRGAGFTLAGVGADGEVYFTHWKVDEQRSALRVYRADLRRMREFAAREPMPVARDAAAWAALVEAVWKEAQMPANVDGGALTAARLTKLAEAFSRLYRKQFHQSPPDNPVAFDWQRAELRRLSVPTGVRPRLRVVIAAAEGESLRRRHRARWHLTAGPLTAAPAGKTSPAADSPFGFAVNPFLELTSRGQAVGGLDDDEEDAYGPSLQQLLKMADGRPLVLANDPKAGRAAVEALTDPDFARGRKLLEDNRGDEAERVLLAMMNKPAHAGNTYLALHVGKVLYDHQRFSAVGRLMDQAGGGGPGDAHRFNLLGLTLLKEAQLSDDPVSTRRRAVEAFQKALRQDLRFQGGYLNLADAYQQLGDAASARLCLKRAVELVPYGPYTRDARERLAALGEGLEP